MEREKLGSRLGFILLSAGCAIGIGNVWKFPYVAGQNGGGVFLLLYLLFLFLLGVPVMTMEFAMGRASNKSIVGMYPALTPKKKPWFWHGRMALVGNYVLMMFYTTVAGWMLKYFVDMATGVFARLDGAGIQAQFSEMIANPWSLVLYMGIVVMIGFGVCAIGLQKGLERVTKWMMLALLAIMVVLAVNALLTPGAREGLEFYLVPNLEKAREVGWINVISAAMSQAFFTLSLGIGSMAIFGSYIDKKHTLLKESMHVAGLDTFVALVAGLIIIPTCFAYNVEVSAGPSLIFITLPNIFNAMPMGRVWGAIFFIFMSFAALSTVLAVFENILSSTMELFGWSRKKACLINGIVLFVLSLPCALGFNVLSAVEPMGAGTNIMDFEDFLVSNLLLPLGSLLFVLYCTSRLGWGWESFRQEANTGKGIGIPDWMKVYCGRILPVVIFVLFVLGLFAAFK